MITGTMKPEVTLPVHRLCILLAVLLLLAPLTGARAAQENSARLKQSDIKLLVEPPTLFCLSFQCSPPDVPGLEVQVHFRKKGEQKWRRSLNLLRVHPLYISKTLGAGKTLFAGSILELTPDTAYEVRLDFVQKKKVLASKTLIARTWKEPQPPKPKRTLHVKPGEGGGTGIAADPFLGVKAANRAARPGDLLLLHAGTYSGIQRLTRSGTAQAPIVWKAAGDGEVLFDGKGAGCVVPAGDLKHVFIEGIHIKNGKWGMTLHRSSHITVRRVRMSRIKTGISANFDQERIFIADCTFQGTTKWTVKPRNSEPRGVEIAGRGHVVMHNSFRDFRDAVDTRRVHKGGNLRTYAIDICYNEINGMQDDGIEHDFSFCNTRSFYNRLTNCGQGISFQPIFGGPVYCFRNVLMNLRGEPFKLHANGKTRTIGGVIMHNTVYRAGMPTYVYGGEPIASFQLLNNLFVGTAGNYGAEFTTPATNCHLDGNVYVGKVKQFIKWNRKRYGAREDFFKATGMEKHGLQLTSLKGLFAKAPPAIADPKARAFRSAENDLRLAPGSPLLDKALRLRGVNDKFKDRGPDAGAYELGDKLPAYGPRP
jgi:Chondroitinase B